MTTLTQLQVLFNERKLPISVQNEWSLKFSNQRVSRIEKLKDFEQQQLLEFLQSVSLENIINGIYKVCESLGVISTINQSADNDRLIINFCLKALASDNYPELKEKSSLKEIKYITLYVVASDLGEFFIKKSSQLN